MVAQLSQELYNSGLLVLLIANLARVDFEGKKDVALIFNNILRRQIGTRSPTVDHICNKPEILFMLVLGFVLVSAIACTVPEETGSALFFTLSQRFSAVSTRFYQFLFMYPLHVFFCN